jgi:dolichol kinase
MVIIYPLKARFLLSFKFISYNFTSFSKLKIRTMRNLPQTFKDFLIHCAQDPEYKHEIQRKLFHILTIAWLPILYIFLSKKMMLSIIFPIAALIIAADFYRHKNVTIGKIFHFTFGHILRESEFEENSWTGATFMALAAVITFTICPKSIAICAFFILAVSDCLAALVGKKMTSKEFFEKSIAGSIAFGVSAFIILVLCGIFFNEGLAYYFFGTFAVFATTIIEARPSFLDLDDNLTIPLVFSSIMMFFGLVWSLNY